MCGNDLCLLGKKPSQNDCPPGRTRKDKAWINALAGVPEYYLHDQVIGLVFKGRLLPWSNIDIEIPAKTIHQSICLCVCLATTSISEAETRHFQRFAMASARMPEPQPYRERSEPVFLATDQEQEQPFVDP